MLTPTRFGIHTIFPVFLSLFLSLVTSGSASAQVTTISLGEATNLAYTAYNTPSRFAMVVNRGLYGSIASWSYAVGKTNTTTGNAAFSIWRTNEGASAPAWMQTITDSGASDLYGVAVESDHFTGDAYVAGVIQKSNGKDIIVARIPASGGSPVWTRVYNNADVNGDDSPI